MRATILPWAIILTNAHRVGSGLWPRGVLWPEYCLCGVSYFYYPTMIIFSVIFLVALVSDEPEVFLLKYS